MKMQFSAFNGEGEREMIKKEGKFNENLMS